MRDTDGCAAVSNTVGELVDGLSLVKAGEAEVVVWAVCSDVLGNVFLELSHELLEVWLAANSAQMLRGEVAVHAGTVPVAFDWLAMELNVDAVFLTNAHQDVASDPDLVRCSLCAFAEDLEFPLTFCHFSVDAFVVDACLDAEVEVFFNDRASDVAYSFKANAAIVWALWSWVTVFWEAEWATVLVEEIFLLETDPETWIFFDRCTCIGYVRCAVWIQNIAHNEEAIVAGSVWIKSDWAEKAIRAAAFSLLCGAAVESPFWAIAECKCINIAINDFRFAAKVWDWLIAVEPEVFEFQFGHFGISLVLIGELTRGGRKEIADLNHR